MKVLKIVLLVILNGLIITGCSHDNDDVSGSGMLEANEALVSAETGGQIIDLRVSEGDHVSIGDTLLIIDPSRLELERKSVRAGQKIIEEQLQNAQVQLQKAVINEQYARKERDRVANLIKSGTTTQQTLDRMEQEYQQAELNLQSAKTNEAILKAQLDKIAIDIDRIDRSLRDCYPTSPVNGVITTRHIDAGELASPGKALVKITQLDSVWVKIYLPNYDFAQVKIGDSATVDTESGGEIYRGVVIWTSEEAEFTPKNIQTKKSRADFVFAVKILVANTDGKLKIGMPVYAAIDTI